MPSRSISRPLLAIAAAGMLAVVTACAPSPAVPEKPDASPAPVGTPSVAPVTPAPETPVAAPTCETLISQTTVDALTAEGWTVEKREFTIAGEVIADGMQCFWADFAVASDHGQLYGWAPMSTERAKTAIDTLIAEGWLREDSDRGVYITVDPKFAFATDEEGYGMTYLFGDGWVTLSDTKQGLVLIEAPQQ